MSVRAEQAPVNFIQKIIDEDLQTGKHGGRVHTRFPPEPNGYLHIGHSKSICLNFGLAERYQGKCNLRFDDTNPDKEEQEFVNAIKEDIHWLGFDWDNREFYASDYFEKLYDFAVDLIRQDKAFVDDLTFEDMRDYRGTLTEPGRESPNRERSMEENLDLFARMRQGEFEEGSYTLRAKIDMGSPNLIMRDPVLYRIKHTRHHRTGDNWYIYPMYDFTHCLSDAIEHITHSICTLEFQDNRALYDWVIDQLDTPSEPRQYEFARLILDYTITSKRKLASLVEQGHVRGWDDPRMPTLHGIRRRGFTPASIRDFCVRLGVTKNDTRIDMAVLENSIREDLDSQAPRALAVINPLKVVIENYPEGQVEELEAMNHPQDPGMGTRMLPFGREIFIEQDDFMEDPPKKFFRLAPGAEVRLRYAYFITCTDVIRDAGGQVTELRCRYDPETRGGNAPDGRKVKGTIHWVSAAHAVRAEVRLYDRLFNVPQPDRKGEDWLDHLNPESEQILDACLVEPSLAQATAEDHFQFERLGYFCADRFDYTQEYPVFNRVVTLRDTWGKMNKG